MTNAIWIRDLGAFSVQVAALVFAGAAVAFLCRLRQPRAMLLFWRFLFFACLALPFCQPWQTSGAPPDLHVTIPMPSAMPVAAATIVPTPTGSSRSFGEVLIVLLIAGAAIRAAWLARARSRFDVCGAARRHWRRCRLESGKRSSESVHEATSSCRIERQGR